MRLRLALPVALAALALVPASAMAFTVTSTADGVGVCPSPSNCTLRSAVALGGPVDFAPGLGPITLTSRLTVSTAGMQITDDGDQVVQGGGTFSPLVEFAAGNALVSGVKLTNPNGTGIQVDDAVTGVKIQQSPIFNATTPISLGSGSNGGITAPTGIRVGPRQPDGSLPLTGTAATGGRVDAYSADKFLGNGTVSAGSFSVPLATEPTAGDQVGVTLTGANGTSQYATTTVGDITSPTLKTAFAFSTNEVIVIPSEPLAGGSLNLSDFSLEMAGAPRPITQGAVAPDGSKVYLISSQPWGPGEAGRVSLTGAGVLTDLAGNFNLGLSPVLVGAAPGDFSPPLVQNLKIRPTKACLTKGPKCKHPGITITFTTNEVGKAIVVINRASNRRAGEFVKKISRAGNVKITWRGTIHGRKLRVGRYVVEVSMQDLVGNVTDSPPFQPIRIVRR